MKGSLGRIIGWAAGAVAAVAFVSMMVNLAIGPAWLSRTPPEATALTLPDVLFYVLALFTVLGALGVAISRNILYSAIGLLVALLGAGSLYVLLSADFLAVTQLLVYIGGVLVLILFAVMLTNRITDVKVSNASVGPWGGAMLFGAVVVVLGSVAVLTPWSVVAEPSTAYTTARIGDGFLTRWLLPFEVASMVLLATLVGAVLIARKETKAD
jgi:NADH-quinone oxidoreductase subunit J